MPDSYLIAHKVRGSAAFDVAQQLPCPECNEGCTECDHTGYWWIIPTSGHRAYPYWSLEMDDLVGEYDLTPYGGASISHVSSLVPEMPSPWPDHYPDKSSPRSTKASGESLLAKLGLVKKSEPFRRRI